MNEFDSIFDKALWNSKYIGKSKQWEKISHELHNLTHDKAKIKKAHIYFESTYYPAKLAQYHTPEALFKKFWEGDLESYGLDHYDQEMKRKLHNNGFDRETEIKTVEYRRKMTQQVYDAYRQKIKTAWAGLNEDAKKIAAIVYGEVSKVNKLEPSEEMRLVASLLRNRVEYVNKLKNESQAANASKEAKAKYKQILSDFGSDNYQSIISHSSPRQFGSYDGPLYKSMMNSKFPDDAKAVKTAMGCIKAAGEIYNTGVPQIYARVMYMRTDYDTQAPAQGLEGTFIHEGGNNFWKIKP